MKVGPARALLFAQIFGHKSGQKVGNGHFYRALLSKSGFVAKKSGLVAIFSGKSGQRKSAKMGYFGLKMAFFGCFWAIFRVFNSFLE